MVKNVKRQAITWKKYLQKVFDNGFVFMVHKKL